MRAVRNAPPGVEVVDVPEPDGDGELIRVAAVGICASDFMYLRYGSTQVAGHEIAGTRSDGTPVAVEAIMGCGQCAHCAAGNYQYCPTTLTSAPGMSAPGGMSEYYRAPSRVLTPLPAGLALGDACLIEPGSVAWHAVGLGQVGPGMRVAVVGAGAIGLLAAAAAQAMGAAEVSVEARHPHQLSAREQIGATAPSGLYDVVIEAGGNEGALHRAIELARQRGTVVYVSAFYDKTELPHAALALKEVALRPSQGYGTSGGRRDFAGVAQMLAGRPELPELLITHRFPLEDAAAAFATAADRSQGVFRVVVEP